MCQKAILHRMYVSPHRIRMDRGVYEGAWWQMAMVTFKVYSCTTRFLLIPPLDRGRVCLLLFYDMSCWWNFAHKACFWLFGIVISQLFKRVLVLVAGYGAHGGAMLACTFNVLNLWSRVLSYGSNKDRSARLQSNYMTTRRSGNIQIRSRRWSLISITSDDKFNFTCNIYSRRRRWRRAGRRLAFQTAVGATSGERSLALWSSPGYETYV